MSAIPFWVIVLIKSVVVLFIVVTTFAYAMLFERKVMGWMQLRPDRTGSGRGGCCSPPPTR